MSQTETLLLVALGFAFALVLAMIFGFAIWSAANRWAAFKRRREVPTTILDMQAEREGLRAQYAMAARRLEFLVEEARSQAAEKTAQVNRHRNRTIVMSKDLIAKDAEIATLRALAAELTAETNKRARLIARLTGHEVAKLRSFDLAVPEGAKPFSPAVPSSELPADAAPLDRIKAKIAELNALSAQIAGQHLSGAEPGQSAGIVSSPPHDAAAFADRVPPREPMTLTAMRGDAAELDEDSIPETFTALQHGISEAKPVEFAMAESIPDATTPPEPAEPALRKMTLAEKFKALRGGVSG